MRKLLVLIIVVLASCSGNNGSSSSWHSTTVVDAVSGKTTKLSDVLPSKMTLMALWSVWCGPCKEELPRLEKVFQDGTVSVIGVNIGDDAKAVSEYVSSLDVSFPMYRDEGSTLLSALKVPAVPATFAIDGNGKILWSHLGVLSADDLKHKVDDLVNAN